MHLRQFYARIHFRRLLLTQMSLNIISIFLLIARIFVNVAFQVIKTAHAEDRYEEEAHNPNEEGQYVFQSLRSSPESRQ